MKATPAPDTRGATMRSLFATEDDPERLFQRAQKVIFKNDKNLTAEATEACHQIGVNPDSLLSLSVENFFSS